MTNTTATTARDLDVDVWTEAPDAWDVAYDAALAALPTVRATGSFGNTAVYQAMDAALLAAGFRPDAIPAAQHVQIIAYAAATLAERRDIIAALGPDVLGA